MSKRITCTQCKKRFTPSRVDAKYCSAACKQSAFRKAQDKISALHTALTKTGFLTYVAYEVRRAGSVEILRGHTTASFVELHTVWSYCNKASAFKTKERAYELSHIFPVCGIAGKIGCLHPSNLVVQRAGFNRRHGNKYFSGGKSISRASLKPRWLVDEKMPRADIFKLIFNYLGDDILRSFKKQCQPKKLAKVSLLDWFDKKVCLLDKSVDLKSLGVDQLRHIQAELQSKEVFNLKFDSYSLAKVTFDEIARLTKYRQDSDLTDAQRFLSNLRWDSDLDFFINEELSKDGNDAAASKALELIEPVLLGKPLRLPDLAWECQLAREAAVAEYERLQLQRLEQRNQMLLERQERDAKRVAADREWRFNFELECAEEYERITGNLSTTYIHDQHYQFVQEQMCPF